MDNAELHNSIETRIASLELRLSASTPKDFGPEVKALKSQIDDLKKDVQVSLSRRIPSTDGLVTTKQLQASLREMGEFLANNFVKNEQSLNDKLSNRIDNTVVKIHSDVMAAKQAANSQGVYAAGMLLTTANKFAR